MSAEIESLSAHDLAEIKAALNKLPQARSYDDLLLLKSYIAKTEFVTKNLAGVVNPRQMNDICRGMCLESYQSGETVFNQGDTGDKIYVLLSGSCEVRVKYKIDLTQGESEIREKLMVTYHDGQFFGERALHNDEPRTATVICKTACDLISISKIIYLNVLSDAKRESAQAPSKDVLGTKESVISLLSKMRERRTNQELDAVAAYLWRRIPFFQKFSPTQLIELCRVAETVSIWGKSILFKQGQIGQAFYVILTGSVEVWVQDHNAEPVEKKPTAPGKAPDLFEDLGIKVNQLVSGDVFGERALESESSQRMASISTCEDLTELLVIAKEDYHNLVYVMMHADSMQRLTLLRKTELFRSVDVVHLKALARFMEPRKYAIDEPLFIAGRKAVEMIIIDVGECRAETVIREGFEKMNEEEKREFHSRHYMQATHEEADDKQGHRHYDLYEHSHPLDAHRKKVHETHGSAGGSHGHSHDGSHGHGHSAHSKDGKFHGANANLHPHNPHNVHIHYPVPHKVSTIPASEHDKHYVAHLDFRQDSFHHADNDLLHHKHHASHDHHLPGIHSHHHPHSAKHSHDNHGEHHKAAGSHNHDEDGAGNHNTTSNKTGHLSPIDEIVKGKMMKRLNTNDLIPYGELKTVNLGRIAPASVLATYITQCETIHNEVYHPETVVASTLVTAYTIGKHDFFNHMPKDTRTALVKLIKEFKTPMLSSLWENVPRVLDEEEWKKSKTWEIYIDQVVRDKKDANIFSTYQHLSRFHISSNSGNNAQTKIAMKNELLMRNNDHYGFHKTKVEVSMDWGLKHSPRAGEVGTAPVVPIGAIASGEFQLTVPGPLGSHVVSQPSSTNASSARHSAAASPVTVMPPVSSATPPPPAAATATSAAAQAANTINPAAFSVQPANIVTAMDGKILPAINDDSSLIGSAVSKMIRNRINYSHFSEKMLSQATVAKPTTGMSDGGYGRSGSSTGGSSSSGSLLQSTKSLTASERVGSASGDRHSVTTTNMPFFLIQIHREKTVNSSGVPNLYDFNGRGVKCYLRLCGSFTSCAQSKESADNQMESVYLTLFKSDAAREKELVLHWQPFKGFDSVPMTDSDHFIIYCRSTPLEFASINPSKNIFNATFPAICKKDGQRFSCIIANKLNEIVPMKHREDMDEESMDSTATAAKKAAEQPTRRVRNSVLVNSQSAAAVSAATTSAATAAATSAAVAVAVAVTEAQQALTAATGAAPVGASSASFAAAPLHPQASQPNLAIVTETAVAANGGGIGSAKKPIVPYLLEFSVLNEVLMTCGNRLDCIRFAIQKFGSFTDSSDPLPSPTRVPMNSTTGIGGSSSLGQKIYLRKANGSSTTGSSSSYSGAQSAANQTVERVLNIANNENKRICVVPLFQWLLVNEDTFKAMDFINVFTEEANKSQAEDKALAMEDEIARSNRLNGKSKLINSFSEAGFLTTKYATKANNDSPEKVRNVIDDGDDDESVNAQDRAISIKRSLRLLEKDLQTKELSKKIHQQSLAARDPTSHRRRHITPLTESSSPSTPGAAGRARPADWGFAPRPILPHQEGHPGSRPTTADEIDLSGGVGSIKLEARLKKLNETSDMRAQFIAHSKKLNDEEHVMMVKLNGAVGAVPAGGGGGGKGSNKSSRVALGEVSMEDEDEEALLAASINNGSRVDQKDILQKIEKRTDVALSIHNMAYSKTSSFPEQQQGGAGGRMSNSLSRAGKGGFVSSVGIREPAPLQPPGAVGKRISENIRLLSESLNSRF